MDLWSNVSYLFDNLIKTVTLTARCTVYPEKCACVEGGDGKERQRVLKTTK